MRSDLIDARPLGLHRQNVVSTYSYPTDYETTVPHNGVPNYGGLIDEDGDTSDPVVFESDLRLIAGTPLRR